MIRKFAAKRWLDLGTVLCCGIVLYQVMKGPSYHGDRGQSRFVGRNIKWVISQKPSHAKYLIVALSPGCHFCTNSAGFYRRIISSAIGRNDVQVIAVMPPNPDLDKEYLAAKHIPFGSLHFEPLDKLGIEGTPTIFLTNDNGRVLHAWQGQLDHETEDKVLRALFG